MSVKKRLFWSYILMFALPLAAFLLVSVAADRLSWIWLLQQRFTSMEDFQQQVRLAGQVSRLFTLLALVGTLLAVNRLLSRGVLRTIERSLEELSEGLRRLREGELSFRLPAGTRDEFSAVRADFNAAAGRLEQLVEQERLSDQNRRELLAGISHDLRSPLTAIRAYAEGLLDGVAVTPESQKQYLTIIRDKTRAIQGLVNQLFLFSRMDLGQNQDQPEPVSLGEELEGLLTVLSPEYAGQGLTLRLGHTGGGRVLADPETLSRVVSNIAENSRKYGATCLDITLREQEAFVEADFADNGPGVPQEALPHIFDAFYRADPARSDSSSGSGLGLAIVSRAVRNMRGRIIAANRPEGGLLIRIQLPKWEDTDGTHSDH